MSDSYIPTLENLNSPGITEPMDILNYLLGFTLINPGNTSELHEQDMASLGGIHARVGDDPTGLASEYTTMLQSGVNRHFPNGGYTVSVDPEEVSETEFKLVIHIQDRYGNPVISNEKFIKKVLEDVNGH